MALSGIRSPTTYHKAMDFLKDLGYVKYRPSYHPVKGSEVSLLGVTTIPTNDHDLNQDCPSFHQPLNNDDKDLDKETHDLVKGDKDAVDSNQ